jgi:hypothetical protein
MANLDAMFAADPAAIVVGPFGANEVGTEIVRTQNMMAVPPKYIPIILGQRLTPWEAYTRLGGAIRMDGQEADCANLLTFLRAACTIPAGGAMTPTVQRPASMVLRVDEMLYHHLRTNIVLRDLPRLQESNLLEPSLHVAQAINELVMEQRAA